MPAIDPGKARLDPEAVFDRPAQIARSTELSASQKHAVVEQWRNLVLRRLAATSEGMPPNGTSASDMALIDELDEVERRLPVADSRAAGTTRH